MRARALRMLAAAVPAMLSVATACGQGAGDATKGLQYAERNCASCHSVNSSDGKSPVHGLATFKVIANTPGMTGTALVAWLRTPHKIMPNLIIAPDDIDDVVAYITSLRDRRASIGIDVKEN